MYISSSCLCNNKDFREEVCRCHPALTLTLTHGAIKNQSTAPPCGHGRVLQEGAHNVWDSSNVSSQKSSSAICTVVHIAQDDSLITSNSLKNPYTESVKLKNKGSGLKHLFYPHGSH